MSSIHKIVEFSKERNERHKNFFGFESTNIKVIPGNWVLPGAIDLKAIKSFPIYEDDIWIVTFPKCGTTWMQELVWLLINNVDVEGSKINKIFSITIFRIRSTF